MKILVYGAGVIGSLFAVRLFEAGQDVSLLARGTRLASLRKHGVQLAEADSQTIRTVAVPIVDRPSDGYDLIVVFVRTHQVESVLESLETVSGDVLFMLNWAAGPEPLGAVIGLERVLLGYPVEGGTMDGEVVLYRPSTMLTRAAQMPIGEPDGRSSPRLERIIRTFRSAGINAKAERRMDEWLKTHAAFEQPLGRAVHAAGGLEELAGDTHAIRAMIGRMRENLRGLPGRTVPGGFTALRVVPPAILVAVFRRFLRSSVATPLATDTPAVSGELDRITEQLRAIIR